MSIVDFWATVFRLPSKCLKDIEQICLAFLWTGLELKATGAKVAWKDIFKPHSEGGLAVRALKESLWGKWIKANMLKKKSFWEISVKTQLGSWMWKKMLKLRDVAKTFHIKAMGNGRHTSFWFDRWSELGALSDQLGGGIIDMCIRRDATVEDAILNP
ncbi:PREDICTED: uncharacterized mitochondrial protein AtMg00310-like [Brassica oleracea var. oleracea]|uniref:uncharacterized mitochondrial protein AtMg00310-like n=1 Tax=Brassica oleracea var. oleracea TaxID=109376 RepID=UPI0006A734CA|nr:PREDICTED: uncharacterized mitochondrial protein AtMg00310-like [Brassica oleracea var. oleracea]